MIRALRRVLWGAGQLAALYLLAQLVLAAQFVAGAVENGHALGEVLAAMAADPLTWAAILLEPAWSTAMTPRWTVTVALAYLLAAVVVARPPLRDLARRELARRGA